MKKTFFLALSFAMALFCVTFCTTSCSDDTDCEVLVIVKLSTDDNAAVSGASVWIGKEGSAVSETGVTDGKGEYTHIFKNSAILDVKASINGMEGVSSVRLLPGEKVTTTVYIK